MPSSDRSEELTARIRELEYQLRITNAAKIGLEDALSAENLALLKELADTRSAKSEIEAELSAEITSLLHQIAEANTAKTELEERKDSESDVYMQELVNVRMAKEDLEEQLQQRLIEINTHASKNDKLLHELIETKDVCNTLKNRLNEAEQDKEALLEELWQAAEEAEAAETLKEQLMVANKTIAENQDVVDTQESAIIGMQEELSKLNDSHAVLEQELELARINDEHTSLLEEKLQLAAEHIATLNDELERVVINKQELERHLYETIDSRETIEHELSAIQQKVDNVAAIERRLCDLEESIEDDRYKHEEYNAKLETIENSTSNMITSHTDKLKAIDEHMNRVSELESELAAVRSQIETLRTDSSGVREGAEVLCKKIDQCMDYQNIYAMESNFNQLGLTIQTTSNNRMILCKLRGGKAISENVIDDYIFVGSLDTATSELTDRVVEKIKDFVRTNAGLPDAVKNTARVWRNGLKMYESTVPIVNEDKKLALDTVAE